MPPKVTPGTLFHLVPDNQEAKDALSHPDNTRFVSPTTDGGNKLGLEVGFHVPSIPSGHVITTLGRAGNLILTGHTVSRVHAAFEIHPETLVVRLCVRSQQPLSVKVTDLITRQTIDGDCIIMYGKDYYISIASHKFYLKWRDIKSLKDLAVEGYQSSLQKLQTVRSRDLPTQLAKYEAHTCYNTRLHTAQSVVFRDADETQRVLIGKGQFASVYRTVDFQSGNPTAVKVVRLHRYNTEAELEHARGVVHTEIRILLNHKHDNIIECLGNARLDTLNPEIFMPLRLGSLRQLSAHLKSDIDGDIHMEGNDLFMQDEGQYKQDDKLCNQVLLQMLCALDFLAHHKLCHRDLKPENILYYNSSTQGNYVFQLADFGQAIHQRLATRFCGTDPHRAPEQYPEYGDFPLSPKMDVWSLFTTLIDVHRMFEFPPPEPMGYGEILQAVRGVVERLPAKTLPLANMARENPTHRFSAAQMLVAYFKGKGLTTPLREVPPIVTKQKLSAQALESHPEKLQHRYQSTNPPRRETKRCN